MVAVDTLSLPGASIIVYNNWPRVPTATPAFIARYCQIEDPYKEGGLPLKVEVIECPAAEARGYPCSCGFINFVGWNWLGSNANIWDSSVVNGDDLADTFGLHDKKGSKVWLTRRTNSHAPLHPNIDMGTILFHLPMLFRCARNLSHFLSCHECCLIACILTAKSPHRNILNRVY
jgi:hypothetical protein